jgi:guanylate kinase
MNSKRIIIVGHGGSGKDYLKQKFIDKGYKPSVSMTTRPPREGEVFGKDYYFCAKHQFTGKIEDDEFFEYKEFRGWFYGTTKEEFNKSDIFIMTPPAIKELSKEIRESSFVIFIDIDEGLRSKRLSNRNDADSTARRIKADRELFECFTDYDLRITDPNF